MSFLSDDHSGAFTSQITRLLRDESTDNVPLLLELMEGGGVNRRLIGYLFGITVFHPTKSVSERALVLLRKYAGTETVRQAEKLKEGAAYHYNDAEYLGKYRNPEFDIFDFILANKMCLWHRAGNGRSPFFEASHRTLNLTHYPEEVLPESIASLDFVRYITLPAHKQFDLPGSVPVLMQLPLESVLIENLRMEAFPSGLLALPQLRTLTIRRGTHRPRAPMAVDMEGTSFGSTTLERLEIDGYILTGESQLGPFPALLEVEITRCQLESMDFLEKSSRLTHLNLRGNLLSELPAFIGSLSQLRRIDLSGNPLKVIYLNLSELPHLESLELKIGK